MNEDPRKRTLDDLPEAVAPRRRKRLPPLVWLIPIVVAVLGAWIVTAKWLAKGPNITISFRSAEGIEPGKTRIRYKDVDIGHVTTVKVPSADGRINVNAEIVKDAKQFLRDDSRFWVVRPRISAGGVTGIGTLLSGAYIGLAAGKSGSERRAFEALETPPVDTEGSPGREFILHGVDKGSLNIGAPVLFRRVKAGQVVAIQVDDDGNGVTMKIFIDAPFDRFVRSDTRFWQASGLAVSLDASGLKVQTESIGTLLDGGLAFESPDASVTAEEAAADTKFDLFGDHDAAVKPSNSRVRRFVVYFKETLRGLSPGAPIDLRGIVIGEVKQIGLEYERTSGKFRFPVDIEIYPDRVEERYARQTAKPDVSTPEREHELLDRLINAGMRAQLKNGNLITGQLLVAMDFFPKAPPARVDWSTEQPELPTVPGSLSALTDTVQSIATKLDQIPFDQLSAQLLHTMRTLDETLSRASALVGTLNDDVAPQAKAALIDAQKAMAAAQATLSQKSPLQSDLRDALKQVSRSARSLADLSEFLERHPESLIRGKGVNDQ